VNRFEKWLVTRIIRREVKQGATHLRNITGLYQMVREACADEFYEDSAVTLDATLHECFVVAHPWTQGSLVADAVTCSD
jgi:hypothetical protein